MSKDGEETFAEYSLRMARESRLRRESIAAQEFEQKRQMKARRKEDRRRERERRKLLSPVLMELASINKESMKAVLQDKLAKQEELEIRQRLRLCICCGDDRDIKSSGHCQQCWNELKCGIIELPVVSERQVRSAQCRVVRKGTEMS